jgi:hypothetical protein
MMRNMTYDAMLSSSDIRWHMLGCWQRVARSAELLMRCLVGAVLAAHADVFAGSSVGHHSDVVQHVRCRL